MWRRNDPTWSMISDNSTPDNARVMAHPDLKPCKISPSSAPISVRYTLRRASAAEELNGAYIHNARQWSPKHDITQNCQINTYQELHVFFTPQDNNKYRTRGFLVQSLSFPARRRKGGTALHTHPPAGNSCPSTHGYKLSPPRRWINFLSIPYQAERERERCAKEYYFVL